MTTRSVGRRLSTILGWAHRVSPGQLPSRLRRTFDVAASLSRTRSGGFNQHQTPLSVEPLFASRFWDPRAAHFAGGGAGLCARAAALPYLRSLADSTVHGAPPHQPIQRSRVVGVLRVYEADSWLRARTASTSALSSAGASTWAAGQATAARRATSRTAACSSMAVQSCGQWLTLARSRLGDRSTALRCACCGTRRCAAQSLASSSGLR